MTHGKESPSVVQIVEVTAGKGLSEVRKLFEEYASSLEISLDFQNFDEELANLPGDYEPPEGCLLITLWGGQVAGCVGLRRLGGDTCEMKRLFTKAQYRGLGVGRALCEAVIEKARIMGYKSMRLDTLPSMVAARELYKSLGFMDIEPYRYNPVEGTTFMELNLMIQL